MPATVTVTGKIGPAVTMTAAVFTGVASFGINCFNAEVLSLTFSDGRPPVDISIAAATTLTLTVSGDNYALTIS